MVSFLLYRVSLYIISFLSLILLFSLNCVTIVLPLAKVLPPVIWSREDRVRQMINKMILFGSLGFIIQGYLDTYSDQNIIQKTKKNLFHKTTSKEKMIDTNTGNPVCPLGDEQI